MGAWDLESGAEGLDGALGDGAGKWQLMIESDSPVAAMSLLRSPTGHLTNLSTAPVRGARGGAVQEPQTAESVFQQLISSLIVQSKCISCHVEGGASANTRLVFVTDENPDHEAINLRVFEDFLDEEEDGASYILNKIQGALGHGGGIQVAAGTENYANMERFLGLLGEDVGPVAITPDTLFDGVKIESARSTLRRAAIVFAGRIPTDVEYESIRTGSLTSLRAAIRGLMEGPEFHEFLIRGSNDRLLTDRDIGSVLGAEGFLVEFDNEYARLCEKAVASGDEAEWRNWEREVQHGASRAPLELIARVVKDDLPYTEILTAEYIMANPIVARAYGATTTFDDTSNPREFRPSQILSYYRNDDTKVYGETKTDMCGPPILDPGELATDYPHAGILNTKAFLQRYPTTATNRNRARSRWTYYHFLGLDIEKSASRTTDPVALADTNNPTMNNPACTVCHTVMDPVAGAFQNYGDTGFYRDEWGGLDSLDEFYKNKADGEVFDIKAASWADRQTHSMRAWLEPDGRIFLRHVNNHDNEDDDDVSDRDIRLDSVVVRAADGSSVVYRVDWEELDQHCMYDGSYNVGSGEDDHYQWWGECGGIPVTLPNEGTYTIEVVAWADRSGDEFAKLEFGADPLHRDGDTWYRDMRTPGLAGELAPNSDNSLQWLAERIVSDVRFAEATVRFWWPAIMGSEFAEPPADESDADFDGLLLASNAQAAELAWLARGFRRGFHGGPSYNLKDLLVEIVLSRWFRAEKLSDDSAVRATALAGASSERLLTPEELARKTAALTGFQWGRVGEQHWRRVHEQKQGWLADVGNGYGLLYGGIDSAGVTDRARDLTTVMAGVGQSHALESSCPIVMREFYLLSEQERRLFGGIDKTDSPLSEFGGTFEVAAASREEIESFSVKGHLAAGEATVKVAFLNDFWDGPRGDRDVLLDRLTLKHNDEVIYSYEIEDLDHQFDCHHIQQGAFHLSGTGPECVLTIPLEIPMDGSYEIVIDAWGDQHGDELPKLEIAIETDIERSAGSAAIKHKLVDLHDKLLGVQVHPDSPEIVDAYELFIDVWQRKQESDHFDFDEWAENIACDWRSDFLYFDGILNDYIVKNEFGDEVWDTELIDAFMSQGDIDWSDSRAAARTWTVVLAYLLMDYRYLYL